MATQKEIEVVAQAIAEARGGSKLWHVWVEPARAAIDALDKERNPPLSWDARTNRRYEPVEKLAQEIYESFSESNSHPWVPNGNSLMQDEARLRAREVLRANEHTG